MFEFDPAKSDTNKRKHGIDFDEARAIWQDDDRLEIESRDTRAETRWLVIGRREDRIWVAIITYRDHNIRIISCRRARPTEEQLYEQAR